MQLFDNGKLKTCLIPFQGLKVRPIDPIFVENLSKIISFKLKRGKDSLQHYSIT